MAANQTVTFEGTVYDVGGPPSTVIIGDVNGDRRLDIVVNYYDGQTPSVLLGGVDGDGKQTFLPRIDYKGQLPNSPAPSLDLDGDGKSDLVSLVHGIPGRPYDDFVSVRFGDGIDSEGKPT